MIFRLVLLWVVSWLGAIVFYSRRDFEPRKLLLFAAWRAVVICLWTTGAFLAMTAVQWALVDS